MKKTLWITRTAVMIALLIAAQFATRAAGQFVTGSCVNLILGVTALCAGLSCAAAVACISPIFAYLFGIGPAFLPLVPAIAIANLSLVVVLSLTVKENTAWFKRLLMAAAAAVVKLAVIYTGVVLIALPLLNLPEQKAAAITASFTWPQLVTALIGGILAVYISPLIGKALKRSASAE